MRLVLSRPRWLAGLAIVGVAAAFAGCGGDSSADTTTAATTTATTTPATTSTTSTAPATGTTATTGTAAAGEVGAYVDDVQKAAAALTAFGTSLQSTTSLEDLKAKIPAAKKSLDEFDAAIAKLGTYTLADDTLDQQRAGLNRTGPRVSETLRDFLDAAEQGDAQRVQALVPEVTSAIQAFQQAATGG